MLNGILMYVLIREASLRVPSLIGSSIGIVGALILGESAVNAGIVSPTLIIIVAITGIASFAIPDFSFGFHVRVFRFWFIALGFTAGFLGIDFSTIDTEKMDGLYWSDWLEEGYYCSLYVEDGVFSDLKLQEIITL